jgi:hypothetical protein
MQRNYLYLPLRYQCLVGRHEEEACRQHCMQVKRRNGLQPATIAGTIEVKVSIMSSSVLVVVHPFFDRCVSVSWCGPYSV